MKERLETVLRGLEVMTVSGRRNVEILLAAMQLISGVIEEMESEEDHQDDHD